jgi:hypothetical protein
VPAIDAAPAQVLRNESWLDARREPLQLCHVAGIERVGGAERKPDAVQRDRIVGADRFERGKRGPAVDEVVLAVHLEPADRRPIATHLRHVRRPQADAGDGGMA